ncbi:MAG: hypothetical protein FJY73_03705 [Candidatus Eisenbacteria bacterium]|nr:hypothetical protein [Candidatus Eisenbacteria bacterium]
MNDEKRDDATREGSDETPKGPPPGARRTEPRDEPEEGSFWEKVRRGVVEGYQIAAEKTDVYARIASRRLRVVGITRRIERFRAEIGERVYDLLTMNPEARISEDSFVKEMVERIRNAEEELTRVEAEIEEIRRESRGRGAETREGNET